MDQSEQTKPESDPSESKQPLIGDHDDYDLSQPQIVERRGHLPGRERIRIVYQKNSDFRRVQEGVLEATEAASIPSSSLGKAREAVKRFLVGSRLPSSQAQHERLTKVKALAVLSSDAISSVAYATEAILINLVVAGSLALGLTLPISLAIIGLLIIVAISYRQTIPAYPNGGGSYIVAHENLGKLPGLVAAAALMIDYVLNVAVSVAAGVLNLVSLFHNLVPYVVLIDIILVILITVANLRGIRESGTIFMLPTYFFVASALLMILVGLVNAFVLHQQPLIGHFAYAQAVEPLSIFLILRAFATGCSAMTGVEAISNGIPAFKPPETRNAAITLTWMATILGALFLGITLLTMTYAIQANQAGSPTVISMIALRVFRGPWAFMFPVFQIATLGILTLSAETSYSDFPRLASLLARDHFLPRQFAFRGDRLAFSVGIIFLAVLACVLLIVFQGNVNALINLFAVGVFISFTLSQAGMVRHWWLLRHEKSSWWHSIAINGLGACTTALVALVIISMKFLEGAWIVVLLIPLMVFVFLGISRHYHAVEQGRVADLPLRPRDICHRLVVPIGHLDRATLQSLAYARSISSHVTAVHVASDEQEAQDVRVAWEKWQQRIPDEEETHLLIIESPYRSLLNPLLAYIDTLHERHPNDTLTIILPEFVVAHWWEYFLHNHTALRLKAALLFRPGIIVTNVPQHLSGRSARHQPQSPM